MAIIIIIIVIAMMILILILLVSIKIEINENIESVYECGFDPRSITRQTFSYRFFLIAILFLIFDVEISLILPLPYLIISINVYMILVWFLLVLVGGLLYEIGQGVLDWVSVAKA